MLVSPVLVFTLQLDTNSEEVRDTHTLHHLGFSLRVKGRCLNNDTVTLSVCITFLQNCFHQHNNSVMLCTSCVCFKLKASQEKEDVLPFGVGMLLMWKDLLSFIQIFLKWSGISENSISERRDSEQQTLFYCGNVHYSLLSIWRQQVNMEEGWVCIDS